MSDSATVANRAEQFRRTNQKELRKVRAQVIEISNIRKNADGTMVVAKANGLLDSDLEPGKTGTLNDDPFNALIAGGQVIEPPFDLLTLAMLPEHSSELFQCIEALEINIEGTGHRFVSRLKFAGAQSTPQEDEEGEVPPAADVKPAKQPVKQKKPEVQKALSSLTDNKNVDPATAELLRLEHQEKVRLVNFFEYCTDESFTSFRRKLRHDVESTGNAYFEVLRNQKGQINGFYHIPSYQMRLGRMDDDPLLVTRKALQLQEDDSVQIVDNKEWKRFRRFVQSRNIHLRRLTVIDSPKLRWFKEFGDPRQYDRDTGEVSKKEDGSDIDQAKRATEIVHLKIYSPRTPYGLPRFIGNLLSIFGDRAAEEINYITLRNNNIPSMIVSVSNGQLTQGTVDRINSFVESQVQGSDNYSKFLIIEAEPIEEEGEDGGQMKLEVKALTNTQHKDSLFQDYSANNQDKIRRSWRLPPIFVGITNNTARAVAELSRKLGDEQIFSPERDEFDRLINRRIFPEMGVRFHKYKSSTPNTTDNVQIVRILAGAEKTGGMTPRIARSMLEEVLGTDLPEFPTEFKADIPFSLTMAEAVKNQADPTEPGQQVTALKSVEAILKSVDQLTGASDVGPDDFDEDETAVSLLKRQFTKLKGDLEDLIRQQNQSA